LPVEDTVQFMVEMLSRMNVDVAISILGLPSIEQRQQLVRADDVRSDTEKRNERKRFLCHSGYAHSAATISSNEGTRSIALSRFLVVKIRFNFLSVFG
jgi:hypothetical protein